MLTFDLILDHAPVWDKIQPIIHNNKLPHAILLGGARHLNIMQFVYRLVALLICTNKHNLPCGSCQACSMLLTMTHPDLTYLKLGEVKIENVRELQHEIYQPPQCASHKFIIIESVETLNNAVSNALLKILEEPPRHIIFILLTEQMSALRPTIRSRCQQFIFSDAQDLNGDYLNLGQLYPQESIRSQLCDMQAVFVKDFKQLISGTCSPCELAKTWSKTAFNDLLWFLYLNTAQMIRENIYQNTNYVFKLFKQLKQIDQYLLD